MLLKQIITSIPKLIKRNIGVSAPVLQNATDPIQQLFLDKIKEYKTKSASGKLDTPELKKELQAELDKVAKQYGGGEGVDMSAFPTFKFEEPKIEITHLQDEK